MNKTIGVIILVMVLIGSVWYFTSNKNEGSLPDKVEDKMMQKEEGVMMEDETKTEEDTAMIQENGDTMMKAGSYETYAPEKLARADSGKVVLFFRASWCPTCKAVDADIRANLAKIPSDTTILDVDYDKSTELKKKYGVTYQHTFVQVDSKGTLLNKWSGSETLEKIISNVR